MKPENEAERELTRISNSHMMNANVRKHLGAESVGISSTTAAMTMNNQSENFAEQVKKSMQRNQRLDSQVISLEMNRINVEDIFHVKEIYLQLKHIVHCCNNQ